MRCAALGWSCRGPASSSSSTLQLFFLKEGRSALCRENMVVTTYVYPTVGRAKSNTAVRCRAEGRVLKNGRDFASQEIAVGASKIRTKTSRN